MWFLHFLAWAVGYFFIGTLCLVLFARRWPETFLVERVSSSDAWNQDADGAARMWAIILWPLYLFWYLIVRTHDFFTWLFSSSVKETKLEVLKEQIKPTVEEEIKNQLKSRVLAEEELSLQVKGG